MNDDTTTDVRVDDPATDESVAAEDAEFAARLQTPRLRRGTAAAAPALAAAMLAVGEVIEPDKTEATVQVQAGEPHDDEIPLDFGDLPPLD